MLRPSAKHRTVIKMVKRNSAMLCNRSLVGNGGGRFEESTKDAKNMELLKEKNYLKCTDLIFVHLGKVRPILLPIHRLQMLPSRVSRALFRFLSASKSSDRTLRDRGAGVVYKGQTAPHPPPVTILSDSHSF